MDTTWLLFCMSSCCQARRREFETSSSSASNDSPVPATSSEPRQPTTTSPTVHTARPYKLENSGEKLQSPSVSVAEPAVSAAQPTVSGTQPTVSAAEPSVSTSEPTISATQPTVSVTQPTVSPRVAGDGDGVSETADVAPGTGPTLSGNPDMEEMECSPRVSSVDSLTKNHENNEIPVLCFTNSLDIDALWTSDNAASIVGL